MKLIFAASRLPRTITKAEWKEIWRWKRQTERTLQKSLEEQMAFLLAYGTAPQHVRRDMIDTITNPPLLIFPNFEQPVVDLRPGGITFVH